MLGEKWMLRDALLSHNFCPLTWK